MKVLATIYKVEDDTVFNSCVVSSSSISFLLSVMNLNKFYLTIQSL